MSSYNKITVGNRTIGGNSPPMVLAEIACSHEGDTELAHKLVDIAADAGAEAIQFQLGSVDRILVPYHPLYKLGLGLQIPYKEWGHIIKHAQERKCLFGRTLWMKVL
ncbi:MAG: hypothetical protein H8D45_13735 [Bacteroidetes bacterium]|nr:hypothetical protein [Bacteroidota bacterium]